MVTVASHINVAHCVFWGVAGAGATGPAVAAESSEREGGGYGAGAEYLVCCDGSEGRGGSSEDGRL